MKQLLFSVLMVFSTIIHAEQSVDNVKNATTQTALKNILSYKPPAQIQRSAAPEKRIDGGGTRGNAKSDMASFQLLAPRHTALTSQSEPVVYWYVSNPEIQSVTLSVLNDEKLVFEKTIAVPTSGLQQINFKELGISLQPNSEYLVLLENANPGNESFSNVTVMYKPAVVSSKNLDDKAQAGYWYDVFQQLVTTHSPQTNALLKQIGIDLSVM